MCGNCKGSWPIVGTGDGMSDDGTQVVIEGDPVLCPCGKNRVFAGPEASCFIDKHLGAANAAASAPLFESREVGKYDERYRLMSIDGRPLVNVRYRIVTDRGRITAGTTDDMGQTERMATDSTERLRLFIWEA